MKCNGIFPPEEMREVVKAPVKAGSGIDFLTFFKRCNTK
jgi:hypothetical protein